MGGGARIVHEAIKEPNLVKELAIATGLGLFAASLWKKAHWDMKKSRTQFYDMLDTGELTVVVDE